MHVVALTQGREARPRPGDGDRTPRCVRSQGRVPEPVPGGGGKTDLLPGPQFPPLDVRAAGGHGSDEFASVKCPGSAWHKINRVVSAGDVK